VRRFHCGRPSSAPTLVHLHVWSRPMPSASSGRCQVGPGASWTPHVNLTPSRAGNHYAPDPPPCPLPPKLIPFLYCDTARRHRPNSHRWVIHPSPLRTTRMIVCPPATLSHRVGCGAPWPPVTAARLRLLHAALSASEILATPAPRCSIQASVSCHHIPSSATSLANC
jgi:hypothetical protein